MVPARGLVLVRHAMPEVVQGRPPADWDLGGRGREDCVVLAHHLARLTIAPVAFASNERKAEQTASVLALRLGLTVRLDERFREVERPPGWDDDYRTAAGHYLARGERDGWEPVGAVRRRFGAAIRDAVDSQPVGDVMVVSHGLAMTLYLSERATVVPGEFWAKLTLPDAWRYEPGAGRLERCLPG